MKRKKKKKKKQAAYPLEEVMPLSFPFQILEGADLLRSPNSFLLVPPTCPINDLSFLSSVLSFNIPKRLILLIELPPSHPLSPLLPPQTAYLELLLCLREMNFILFLTLEKEKKYYYVDLIIILK